MIFKKYILQEGVYDFFRSQKMFRSPTNYGKIWHFYKGKLAKILSKSYFGSHFYHISQNFMLSSLHCFFFVAFSVDTHIWSRKWPMVQPSNKIVTIYWNWHKVWTNLWKIISEIWFCPISLYKNVTFCFSPWGI